MEAEQGEVAAATTQDLDLIPRQIYVIDVFGRAP